MELKDFQMNLIGYYLGRYENGVRHGIGQEITILTHSDTLLYRVVERIYNKGYLIPNSDNSIKTKIVDDIM